MKLRLFHTAFGAIAARMKAFLTALVAWFVALPALAADPFTVAGVPVDATAPSAIQAQTEAIASGQRRAARLLLERLTLEDERAASGLPELTPDVVGPLIRGLSVNNERRSATRYLGDLTIAFNPSAVQQLLRSSGLTMVSSQAQERLVVPVDVQPDSALARELLSGRHAHALTPLQTPRPDGFLFSSPTLSGQIDTALQLSGLQSALVVYGDGRIAEIGSDGSRRSLSGPLSRLVAGLEREWKQTAAVPSASVTNQTASVLYNSLSEWQRLQRAINTSAQVRDARLDAVAKDGALMTIGYGDFARLQSEMRQKGVIVEQDPELGLVIR